MQLETQSSRAAADFSSFSVSSFRISNWKIQKIKRAVTTTLHVSIILVVQLKHSSMFSASDIEILRRIAALELDWS